MELILASTSTYRAALLARFGLSFRSIAPRVDEDDWKARGLAPAELARTLAAAKALSLAEEFPDAAILGGDQLVAVGGEVLGKPGDAQGARRQLVRLAGRTHELVTAIAVWADGNSYEHVDIARLTMRDLSAAEIARYVEADLPTDCAGSYKLESLGVALFERIEAADHSAITGLPLMALSGILRRLSFQIP